MCIFCVRVLDGKRHAQRAVPSASGKGRAFNRKHSWADTKSANRPREKATAPKVERMWRKQKSMADSKEVKSGAQSGEKMLSTACWLNVMPSHLVA